MTQYDSFDFDEKMSLFESIPIDKNPYIWNMAYDEDEEIRLFLSIELGIIKVQNLSNYFCNSFLIRAI